MRSLLVICCARKGIGSEGLGIYRQALWRLLDHAPSYWPRRLRLNHHHLLPQFRCTLLLRHSNPVVSNLITIIDINFCLYLLINPLLHQHPIIQIYLLPSATSQPPDHAFQVDRRLHPPLPIQFYLISPQPLHLNLHLQSLLRSIPPHVNQLLEQMWRGRELLSIKRHLRH